MLDTLVILLTPLSYAGMCGSTQAWFLTSIPSLASQRVHFSFTFLWPFQWQLKKIDSDVPHVFSQPFRGPFQNRVATVIHCGRWLAGHLWCGRSGWNGDLWGSPQQGDPTESVAERLRTVVHRWPVTVTGIFGPLCGPKKSGNDTCFWMTENRFFFCQLQHGKSNRSFRSVHIRVYIYIK